MPRKQQNLDKRDGIWYGRVVIAGRRYRRSLRTGDAREAKTRYDEWESRLQKAAYSAKPAAPSFKAAVIRWEAEVLNKAYKPQVVRRYLTSISMLEKLMGNATVDQIDGKMIADYVSSRAGAVTNATLRRDITALSGLLSACASWGWITENAAARFDRKIIRERRDPIKLVREADYQRVLEALPPPMAEMCRLLEQTGMRLDEAVTLELAEIDHEREQLLLARTKTDRPRTLPWRTPGGDAGGIIRAAAHTRNGYFIANRSGKTYDNFSSDFGNVMRRCVAVAQREKVEFRRFRLHDLRHMFAIRWLKHGGNIYRLSKHLGHTSVKTTEIYLDYLTEKEQEAARFGNSDVFSDSPQIRPQKKITSSERRVRK